ncbi:MAG: DUF502 domain-containing protein [Verrucomicrobiota bacterium]
MLRSLRNAFITGLIVTLPLGVTIIVINFLVEKLGAPTSQFFFGHLDLSWLDWGAHTVEWLLQFISVLIVFLLITLIGFSSRFVLGRWLFNVFERLLDRVPFINTVYRTVKQIVDTVSAQNKAVFQQVVLIEYPRPRSYAIGFLTSSARGETQDVTGEHIVNVFVPTTPNPTSGFLLMLPDTDVTPLKMTITDGMKLIISGGAVVPPNNSAGQPVRIENPKAAEAEEPATEGK